MSELIFRACISKTYIVRAVRCERTYGMVTMHESRQLRHPEGRDEFDASEHFKICVFDYAEGVGVALFLFDTLYFTGMNAHYIPCIYTVHGWSFHA